VYLVGDLGGLLQHSLPRAGKGGFTSKGVGKRCLYKKDRGSFNEEGGRKEEKKITIRVEKRHDLRIGQFGQIKDSK